MSECWREEPKDRPSFSQLSKELEDTILLERSYLDLQNFEETKLCYQVPSFNSENSDDSRTNVVKETGMEQLVADYRKNITRKSCKSSTDISGETNVAFRIDLDSDNESYSTYL